MTISTNLSTILGVIMAVAFLVNIIVQMTKSFIPMPTKLWCIVVSIAVVLTVLFAAVSFNMVTFSVPSILLSLFGSFIVAFIAMYGFDTFKELWQRFKKGGNINEQ